MRSELTHPRDDSNGEEVEELIARYLDELNSGKSLDPRQVLADHPGLGHEVLESLQDFVALRSGPEELRELGALGDYVLRRRIGRGGMGIVYEAWQTSLDRRVALKVLPAGIAADDKTFHRFVREAKMAAKLSHPNVVGVYGMGVEASTPYIAMEYVEGETLAEVLSRLRDAPSGAAAPFGATMEELAFYSLVAKAFADATDGLQHAHSKRIVHRDIKPSNLILDGGSDQGGSFHILQRRLRILDFGLARLEGQESITQSGELLGTPLYMSPEQARRRKIAVDHRTDVYSLGATLYEMLTLRPPFQGKDHEDTLSQIIEREPVEPSKLNPRVPGDLETIVLKCLRKEPADRYGTAEALGQDLRRFVRGDAIEARPQGALARAAARLRRHRWKLALAAAFLAAGLAFGWAAQRWRAAERAYEAAAYGPAMSAAVERLDVGRFSLEAHAGRSRGLGLFASGGLLTPLQPEDFRSLLGDEAERSVREAARDLADLAASVPGGRDARYQLARALKLLGDPEGARQAVRRALETDPGFTPASALEAEIDGRPFAPPAERSSENASRPDDDWKGPWLTARASGGRRPRPAERLEAHDRLAAFARRKGEPYIGFSLEVFLGRGAARLGAEDFEGAEEDFAVARHLAPGSLEPHLLLAKTYFLAGRPEEARRTLDRLYADRGEEASAALWIAAVCIATREHRDSLAWIERLGEGALKDRLRAVALANLERWSDAREAAERAVECVPEDLRANALLVWALTHELRSREGEEGEVADATAVRLLEASERAVERAPEHGQLRFLRNVALVTVRRHLTRLATLERRLSMNARKASHQDLHGLQDIVSPALLAMVLAAGVPLGAREVFDDFAADPNPWDGDPVAWQAGPCCPADIIPGGCEGIEGLAVKQGTPEYGATLGTVDTFSGNVRVHARISNCGSRGLWALLLHFDLFQITGYTAGVRYGGGQWPLYITKWINGVLIEEHSVPAGLAFSEGVYELELASLGDTLELRGWPQGSDRPAVPQVAWRDPQPLRTGSAGFVRGLFDRGVISSIRITELAPYFRRGDANVDGVVDVSDALHVARGEVFTCMDAADADDGGNAERGDAGDASAVLDHLFRGGSLPPPGADVPGPDPTEDALGCDAYAPSAPAKLADVRLELTGFPAEVEGRPGETIALDGFAAITVSSNTTSQGPVGWSFGITGQNASVRIGDVNAAATDGAAIFQGGFAFPDDGSGGAAVCGVSAGAVSAMADLSGEGAALPAEGTFTVAPVQVEIPVPDEAGTVVLRFAASCRGAGSPVRNPVRNTVSFDAEPGGSHRIVSQAPALVSWTIAVRIRPAGGRQLPGDANQDGKLDLSDAVWLLGHLFLGTFAALPCEGGTASSPGPGELALLDSNGDGRIDLSDAVRVLGFLFGGSAPPALGAECIPIPGCPERCGQ